MKQFKQLVKELPAKKVVFAFGRYQPPTIGHGLLVAAVKHLAEKQGADHIIYASKTQDKKSNPLPVDRKVYYLKRMFPGANFVAASADVATFIQAVKQLNKKYKNLVMVAGSDRVAEYQKILNKYNGKDFNYDTIEVVSAGERDPDAEGASGMSGTKMREAAKKGDFASFKRGLPSTLTTLDAKRLMNEIREGMGLEQIREQLHLNTSELREQYRSGGIFNIGEKVEDSAGVYEIVDRGTNYISVVNESGEVLKKWIHGVQYAKQVQEDIQPGVAPEEITFKGYTTKNLHHSADAAKAFQSTINKLNKGLIVNDPVAVLNALKATDTYMGLNDLHLEQGKTPDEKELETWKDAHKKAQDALLRVGEFLHHEDYWHMHLHELEAMETKYNPETAGVEMADSYNLEGQLVEMKFTASDKIKVARVIASALGVEDVDKSSNAEMLINTGLRKVRSKPMRPEYIDVLHKMLQTAKEASIKYDEKLVPQKVSEGAKQPNGTDKVGGIIAELSPETLKSYTAKALGSKSAADFTRGVKMAQGSGGEDELRKKSEKRSTGIHTAIKKLTKEELEEAAYWQNKSWQKKMADAAKKERQAREKKEAEQGVKESLEEDKTSDLHSTISHHLDKHISDFKSGHTGMDQFGSKVLAAHKSVAKHHGLEHKHAVKAVNDYVDSKLNEGTQDVDVKNNESDKEAEQQNKSPRTKVGNSLVAPHESDSVRKMKVRQMTEETLEEDQATAEYKVKTYYDNSKGKTVARKVRPHRVTFKGSKKDGEPEVNQPGEDLKNEESVYEGIDGAPAGDMGVMPVGAPQPYDVMVQEEDDEDDIDDKELDDMVDSLEDDDMLDAYEDDELAIIDDETGEEIEDEKVNEEALMEVLSRAERMRAKIRFAKSKAKRERKIKVALKTRSTTKTINNRARKLAVKLMKQRIAKKPLNKLSVAEKERVEKIIQRRKAVINRLAMKLVPKVKKTESERLTHKVYTK